MEHIQSESGAPLRASLDTYYEQCVCIPNGEFNWVKDLATDEKVGFALLESKHVPNKESYSLELACAKAKSILYTADVNDHADRSIPNNNSSVYNAIFHDCQLFDGGRGGVHAWIEHLRGLPNDVKKKTWLMHYGAGHEKANATDFAGFVEPGQEFEF